MVNYEFCTRHCVGVLFLKDQAPQSGVFTLRMGCAQGAPQSCGSQRNHTLLGNPVNDINDELNLGTQSYLENILNAYFCVLLAEKKKIQTCDSVKCTVTQTPQV
mmetsp:Transcript_133967/g.232562  ORF Transcript_133967/g.232562 Transcript_133967/m.232562 type:complete len:104 (+) Transcript_133967:420-731(+)